MIRLITSKEELEQIASDWNRAERGKCNKPNCDKPKAPWKVSGGNICGTAFCEECKNKLIASIL